MKKKIYDWKSELYWRMPERLKETILSLYARNLEKIYYGPIYEKWKHWLQDWKSWSTSYVDEFKNKRLQYIIRVAAEKVPHYRNVFKDRDWKAVKSENDLHLLPFLDKQTIRDNEQALIAEGTDPKSLRVEPTSGTTGTALKIYMPKTMIQKYYAIMEVMVRNVAGVSQEMPRASIGGRPIKRGIDNSPPFWCYNRRWKQLYLSSFHISKNTTAEYIKALRYYGSQWLTGFGSVIATLAENALDAGLEPYPLKAVIVSGDTLFTNMKLSIQNYFQCKCFNHYGQTENSAMAMECQNGRMHIIPMLGIIEILRDDGSYCEPGEVGELFITSLLNDAMPLIRYRVGDYAAWDEEQQCLCGNPYPAIKNLEGRVDDYLVTQDGKKIGRLAAFKRSPSIHSAQLVQDSPGHGYLLVKPSNGYRFVDAKAICDNILERIGKFSLDVVEVPEIPKTPQGKTVTVVRLQDRPAMRATYESLFEKYSDHKLYGYKESAISE